MDKYSTEGISTVDIFTYVFIVDIFNDGIILNDILTEYNFIFDIFIDDIHTDVFLTLLRSDPLGRSQTQKKEQCFLFKVFIFRRNG